MASSNTAESMHDVSLSVVIPTYRRPANLHRLLTALEAQVVGKPDRRVVVVNDGSHDDAYAKVAECFESMIDYVALPANRGPSAARNAGARKVKGRYLVFTDDDCVPPPHWLDWLVADLQEYPYAAVVAGPTRPLPSKSPGLIEHYTIISGHCPKPYFANGLLQNVPTANLAVRRDWFDKIGGFDERFWWADDLNLTFRLKMAGASFQIDWSWFTYHDQAWSLWAYCERWNKYGRGNGLHKGITGDFGIAQRIPPSYLSIFLGLPKMIGSIWKNYFRSVRPGYLVFTYGALDFLWQLFYQLGLRRGYKHAAQIVAKEELYEGE